MKTRSLFFVSVAFLVFSNVSTFAQITSSRAGDSLALVALQDSNPLATLNWDYTQPISTWRGVYVSNDRVDSLKITNKKINVLPSEIGDLSELKVFFVALNNIATLPPEFGNLSKLTRVNLASNQLSTLPKEFGNLTQLNDLLLNKNIIDTLPTEFCNLTSLKRVFISQNKLRKLPQDFGNLTNLTKLKLANNLIEYLPESITNLKNLNELFLTSNRLDSLPDGIGGLTSLAILHIDSNNIMNLPETMGSMAALSQFYAYTNKIKNIPASIGNLSSLQLLWLFGNNIDSIPSSVSGLLSLQKLNVHDNKLKRLPPELFTLPSLTTVWATANNISSIPENIKTNTKLSNLSLDYNALNFSDLESIFPNTIDTLSYVPQQNIGTQDTITTLDSCKIGMSTPGSANRYFWMRNGLPYTLDTSAANDTITVAQNGLFKAGVVSDSVAGLVLYSYDILVRMDTIPPQLDTIDTLHTMEDSSVEILKTKLFASDNTQKEVEFNIIKLPENGYLVLDNRVLKKGEFFTTKDILDTLLTYSHNGSETTKDSFRVVLSDGANISSDTQTVFIFITPVNDAPLITSTLPQSIPEDSLIVMSLGMLTISDPDDSLSNERLIVGTGLNYALNGDTVVPDTNYNGDITVPVKVSDQKDTTEWSYVNLSVKPVNDAPVLMLVKEQKMFKNTQLVIDTTMVEAFDTDGDPITVVIHSGTDYTFEDNIIYPVADFTGILYVPISVTDNMLESEQLTMRILVESGSSIISKNHKFEKKVFIKSNPISYARRPVMFTFPEKGYNVAEIYIYDNLGNEIFQMSVGPSVKSYGWNLENRYGRLVAKGSYLAILVLHKTNGVKSIYKEVLIVTD